MVQQHGRINVCSAPAAVRAALFRQEGRVLQQLEDVLVPQRYESGLAPDHYEK